MRCSRVMATLLLMVCFATASSMFHFDQQGTVPSCMAAEPIDVGEASELPAVDKPAVETALADVANVEASTGFTVQKLLDWIWEKMNTSAGMELMAIACAFAAGKIFLRKPKWKVYYDEYKGHLVSAIKFAEKTIPNNVKNRAAAKADAALNYALGVIQAGKSKAPALDKASLGQALNVLHAEAEAEKTL